MIDIVFSAAAEGSLRASCLQEKNDFICDVDLMLDVGYIDQPIDGKYRRDLYSKMYQLGSRLPDASDLDMGEYFDASIKSIKKMIKRARKGEDIRIWQSKRAEALCELYYICNLLSDIENLGNVKFVIIPSTVTEEEGIDSWGMMNSNKMIKFQKDNTVSITHETIEEYGNKWKTLANENALLRAVVDGEVMSVSEDYYDCKILSCIKENGMTETLVWGNFLDSERPHVSQLICAWRIKEMIKLGHIEVVKKEIDQSDDYARRNLYLSKVGS